MAITTNDLLQEFFPNWILDDRAISWLWLILKEQENEVKNNNNEDYFRTDDHDAPGMRYKMACYIDSDKNLINKIENWRSRSFVPEHDLSWIDKSGRQPTWLLKEYLSNNHDSYNRSPRLPPRLTPRQQLIALLDFSDEAISRKQSTLKRLQAAWVQHQVDDRHFNWYASGSAEKQKCRIAWQWYQDKHRREARYAEEFSRVTDVLEFLDNTRFSLDEKRFHLEEIKKKFKAQQVAANRRGKRQTNLALSDDVRKKLDELSEKEGMNKKELVEFLIEKAYELGI
ncbi:hypothetical protein H0A58_12575 [Alcaligenaceae bacterium]|nr:hypothetical protein [Alcaligenaceae bacterium]